MDPDETVDLVLQSDQDKDPESRPTFVCRHFSGRRRLKLIRLVDQAIAAEREGQFDKTDDLLSQIYALGLVGWRNVADEAGNPVDFWMVPATEQAPAKITALGDLLTWDEMWELQRKIARETLLSEAAKKKSASPAPSPPAPSAPSAAEAVPT